MTVDRGSRRFSRIGERRGGGLPLMRWLQAGAASGGLAVVLVTTLLHPAAAFAQPTDNGACDPLDPESSNSCVGKPEQEWPVAQGNFTDPDDPGWVFFKPFFGPEGLSGPKADSLRAVQYGCGIGPDGTVGCDTVPSSQSLPSPAASFDCGDLRCPVPPPGTTQTVAGPNQPGEYVRSDTLAFTRDVGDVSEGHRIVNGDAWCAVGYQGSVSCTSGANGFTLAPWGGTLKQ